MATIYTPPQALVYGDGERLIVDYFGSGSVALHNPILKNLSWSMEGVPAYSSRYYTMKTSVDLELRFVASHAEWHEQSVPDLRNLADTLTVSQLFAAINRKLDKREAG